MMRSKLVTTALGALALALVCAPTWAADEDNKPKYTIKQVMKECFKGPLLKKVAKGDASAEETEKLHEMLVALSNNEPKKGESESWEKLTGALVKAGKSAVEGDDKASAMLKKAANCKACHSKHK